jgi:hypothetical protein
LPTNLASVPSHSNSKKVPSRLKGGGASFEALPIYLRTS